MNHRIQCEINNQHACQFVHEICARVRRLSVRGIHAILVLLLLKFLEVMYEVPLCKAANKQRGFNYDNND